MLFSLDRVYTFACLALARNVSSFYLKSPVMHFYCFSSDQNIIFVNLTTFYSNKNTLYFPVKRLRCQAQPNWQSEETVSQKGWWICANMSCFSKSTCQSPSDTPSLEKYLASSPSSRVSLFVDSGKMPSFHVFRSSGSMHKQSLLSLVQQWLANTPTLLASTHATILCLVGPFQSPSFSLEMTGYFLGQESQDGWDLLAFFFTLGESMVPCTSNLQVLLWQGTYSISLQRSYTSADNRIPHTVNRFRDSEWGFLEAKQKWRLVEMREEMN